MNENLLLYAISYLLGGIPFGLLLAKLFTGINIKKSGSNSIGATNVLRVLKQTNPQKAKFLAIATVILDASKGAIPILIARSIGFDEGIQWSMAVIAVIGHCYSPYLFFEGGKGVATGAGVLICFLPIEILIALIVWFLIGKVFKISSIASLAALISLIINVLLKGSLGELNTIAPVIIIASLVVIKHMPNIKRLIFKTEEKVI